MPSICCGLAVESARSRRSPSRRSPASRCGSGELRAHPLASMRRGVRPRRQSGDRLEDAMEMEEAEPRLRAASSSRVGTSVEVSMRRQARSPWRRAARSATAGRACSACRRRNPARFRLGASRMEPDVLRPCAPGGAGRAAVDARRSDRVEELSIRFRRASHDGRPPGILLGRGGELDLLCRHTHVHSFRPHVCPPITRLKLSARPRSSHSDSCSRIRFLPYSETACDSLRSPA